MSKLTYKASYYALYAMFAIILIVLGLFYLGGDAQGADVIAGVDPEMWQPANTNALLMLIYGLFGLAVAATKTSTKILSNELDKRKQEEEELVKKMQEMRDKIIRENITFKVKTGAMDKVFGNVSSKQIAEYLNKMGYKVDKKQIQIDAPLDTLGVHNVTVELHKKVRFNIRVNLVK